jgi:integrase
VLRAALDAITLLLDGSRAAPATITRKHAVLHAALSHAVETGLLDTNPLDTITWQIPRPATAVNPAVVASPEQVHALLTAVTRLRPDLAAFFGCLYYAALRPEEAVALGQADCDLPSHGWGMLTIHAAAPRTTTAWTNTGTSHELRGLKHRPTGTIRTIPIPPVLVTLLRRHLTQHGTAPGGLLFHGTRGGLLSESVYGRTWHHARTIALGPRVAATPLARRPYDLRHAALSLWLNADGEPAQIAARAGNSVHVLLTVYTHCIHGHNHTLNQHIANAIEPSSPIRSASAVPGSADRYVPRIHLPPSIRTSGPDACSRRPVAVSQSHGPSPADMTGSPGSTEVVMAGSLSGWSQSVRLRDWRGWRV